jgi:hypothetical protein
VKKTIFLFFLVGAFAVSQAQMRALYAPAFPHFAELVPNAYGFQDAAFIVAGFRALAADVAWVRKRRRVQSAHLSLRNRERANQEEKKNRLFHGRG